jgi:hypothetical protein
MCPEFDSVRVIGAFGTVNGCAGVPRLDADLRGKCEALAHRFDTHHVSGRASPARCSRCSFAPLGPSSLTGSTATRSLLLRAARPRTNAIGVRRFALLGLQRMDAVLSFGKRCACMRQEIPRSSVDAGKHFNFKSECHLSAFCVIFRSAERESGVAPQQAATTEAEIKRSLST